MAADIAANLAAVRSRVAAAAGRAGRDQSEVTLIAVSKTVGPAIVREAVACGVADLGENRAQEFRDKYALLGPLAHWHFIGQLQTNKVKYLVEKVKLIHSVDRMAVAVEIDRLAKQANIQQDVLVEVNVAGEASKSGVRVDEAVTLVGSVRPLGNVRVVGLMTVAPLAAEPEGARPHFRRLRELAAEISGRGWPEVEMRHLSMGMSGDFEVAVEEGATLIRVGTAIFGARA
ncbi:MAG: YggS family pyridoxal phosphate-dependent enzyme [Bacillota bacterium]